MLQRQEERAGAEALGPGANQGKWEKRKREAFTDPLRAAPHQCHLEPLDGVSTIKKQDSRSSNCHQSQRLEQREETSGEYGGQAQLPHTLEPVHRLL